VSELNIKQIIYRPTDIYQQMDNGQVYARYENSIVARAAKVVGTNKNIIKYLNVENKPHFFYIDNGYDRAHFAQAQTQPISQSDYIEMVYVGSLDSRFDIKLVMNLVEACENVRVNVYSPDNYVSPHERIVYHGTANYQELPALLASYHILLMPFNDIVSNHGRSPMKLFEYASTLRPIIMPYFMDDHGLSGVFKYRDLAQLQAIIATLDPLAEYQRDEGVLLNSSWEFKTKQLLDLSANSSV
jgi:teichuronic acid biosynthesis glycosyltransferase TuaH